MAERLAMLNNAVTRFINAYEAALEAREPGEKPVRIRSGEFRDYTKANKPDRRNDNKNMRRGRPDRSADNGTGSGDADNK